MEHKLKREFSTDKSESGSITPTCSCGWVGRAEYNYNDYQYSNLKDQEADHLRKTSK